MLKRLSRVSDAIASWIGAAYRAFDVRDVLVFGGLGILAYGLHLFRPWLAFTVCGVLLMTIGYLMRPKL